jgi:hypothetical protein
MWTKEVAVFFKRVSRDFPGRTEETSVKTLGVPAIFRAWYFLNVG